MRPLALPTVEEASQRDVPTLELSTLRARAARQREPRLELPLRFWARPGPWLAFWAMVAAFGVALLLATHCGLSPR